MLKAKEYTAAAQVISDLKEHHSLFHEWKTKKLSSWQRDILLELKAQDQRKILWVSDVLGNSGKFRIFFE